MHERQARERIKGKYWGKVSGESIKGKYLRNLFALSKEYYQHTRWNHHAIIIGDSEHYQPLFPVSSLHSISKTCQAKNVLVRFDDGKRAIHVVILRCSNGCFIRTFHAGVLAM